MKKWILAAILGLSAVASAEILNSKLVARHQKTIEEYLYKRCGLYGKVTELSSFERTKRVDNGIVDAYFITKLRVDVGIDQYSADSYFVTVESTYHDMYDHANKDWGVYSVLSVASHDTACN